MSNPAPPSCWSCGEPVGPEELDYRAVLVPRSADRGGPVLLLRCAACGLDNVAERNPAGEHLLVPPHLAAVRSSTVKGRLLYDAKKWAAENAERRSEFLSRTRPAMPGPAAEPEPEPAEPAPEPEGGAAHAEEAEPKAGAEAPDARNLSRVLDAYEVLGLPVTADVDRIRKRFRELSRKCHPDRVADLDEEIRKVADRRFRRIRAAYEALLGD